MAILLTFVSRTVATDKTQLLAINTQLLAIKAIFRATSISIFQTILMDKTKDKTITTAGTITGTTTAVKTAHATVTDNATETATDTAIETATVRFCGAF